MLSRNLVIEKVKTMPLDILEEVNDFIEFLELKKKKKKEESVPDKLEESDFKDYLNNLTSYEDMLAKGEIKWK